MTILIDHLVLVSNDVPRLCAFWERVLGAVVHDLEASERGRAEYPCLHFGDWKVNVHPVDGDMAPRARRVASGSGDICLAWDGEIDEAVAWLHGHGVEIELGPVDQEGARGPGRSVYFRDPDGNLLELLAYGGAPPAATTPA